MSTIVTSLKKLNTKLGGRKPVQEIETIADMVDKITEQVDTFEDGGGFILDDDDAIAILPMPSDPNS